MKFFELDTSAAIVTSQLGLASNTVYKAMNTMRLAILSNALDARDLLSAWSPEGKQSPVFGITEQGGWVFADLVPSLTPEGVAFFRRRFQLATSSFGRVIYTAPYRHYATLVFHGGPEFLRSSPRRIEIDGSGGFWPYVRERLGRLRGVTPGRFPLHLKECEFRYNHRKDDIFPLLAGMLCSFVPERAQEGDF